MLTLSQLFPIAGTAGATVTLLGSGFLPFAPEQHVVTFGGVPATGIVVPGTQELRATVPALPTPGPVDIAVSNDGGATFVTLPRAFYALLTPFAIAPANLLQGGARAVYVDGVPVGMTDGPIRLAHETHYAEAEVAQELNPVQLFKQRERWRLFLSLAEVSLDNLRLAFDGATVTELGGIRTLTLGGDTAVREHSLLVQGPGPNGAQRDFFAYRAVVEHHDPLVIARDAPQRLPLTFRLLPDTTLPAGQRILRIAER